MTVRRRLRAGALAAATAVGVTLALAPASHAHARLVGTTPAAGAVLAAAPHAVSLRFDDAVVPAAGAAAIRNGGDGSSLLAGPVRAAGRDVTLPLQAGLGDGDYTVRWRVLGDDGHISEGLLTFGVGSGRGAPEPALGLIGSGARWSVVLARWLFLAGLLAALGGLGFRALVLRGAAARPLDGRLLMSISAAFAVALAGAGLSIVAVPDALHTRFGQAAVAGIAAAAVGAALTEAARSLGRWPLAPLPAALALAAIATVGGHALDPPAGLRPLKVATDLVHVGAAALWIGGIVQVALLLAALEAPARAVVLRRFAWVAGASVSVVVLTGIGRAAFGLSAVHQAWDTGYGRTLLAKTVLLGLALAAAGVARRRPGRVRHTLALELVLVAGIVAAIALLGDLRPGRVAGSTEAAVPAVARTLPPADAVTLAREEGSLAFAVAIRPVGATLVQLTATAIAGDQLGATGLDVRLGADAPPELALPCGSGCYTVTVPMPASGALHRVTVSLGGHDRPAFLIPEWPPRPAAALVARTAARFARVRTLRYDEHIASSPGVEQSSHLRVVAPDRFAYDIEGGGSGIVIGERRWDRESAAAPWVEQVAQLLSLPATGWGARPTNAFEIGRGSSDGHPVRIVTLLDPRGRAWFTASIDTATGLLRRLDMTAAAHFMVDRYRAFDAPLAIEPPVGPHRAAATSSTTGATP